MRVAFADDAARTALRAAVQTVEGGSAVELVIAMRRQSAGWLHVNLIVGAAATFAALAYMLFGSAAFSLPSILFDPFLVGVLAGALVELLPAVKRLLTPRRWRRTVVERAAAVAFLDRHVHVTTGRTGVLVFVSWLEREAAVVADIGVIAAVTPAELARLRQRACLAMRHDGNALAEAIRAFAPAAAAALPRGTDDVNELPDELDAQLGRRVRSRHVSDAPKGEA